MPDGEPLLPLVGENASLLAQVDPNADPNAFVRPTMISRVRIAPVQFDAWDRILILPPGL